MLLVFDWFSFLSLFAYIIVIGSKPESLQLSQGSQLTSLTYYIIIIAPIINLHFK